MTSFTPKYATNLTTRDRGATYKLKPRSFNKSLSTPTSLSRRWSLLSIIAKYIPPQHCTLLWNRVWFLTITLYLLPPEFRPWHFVVVVTATTLLPKWCAQVHNWASRKHLWRAELISWAGYYSEKYHFYCLNGCLAWHRKAVFHSLPSVMYTRW